MNLQRDAVFAFFVFQAMVYLIVSPMIVTIAEPEKQTTYYLLLWFCSLILYFPILFVTYGAMVDKLPWIFGINLEYKSKFSVILFCVIAIVLLVTYYVRAMSIGYFFRRIGSEEAAQLFASLSFFDLMMIKFHDMASPPIMLLSLIAVRDKNCPTLMKVVALVFTLDVLTFALLNSRITLIFMFVFAGIMLLWTGIRPTRLIVGALLVSPMIIYMMIVLINFRSSGFSGGSTDFIASLSPFIRNSAASQINSHEWIDRINCFDLIQIMSSSLDARGFSMGAAWYNPFISLFGPLFGSHEAAELKAIGMTTAKAYMIAQYTDLGSIDYQSCGLTDSYGNFGITGFAISGLINGIVFGLITRALIFGGRGWKLLSVIIFSYYFALFEQEFFSFSVGWIRILPWVVVLGLLVPIRSFGVKYEWPMRRAVVITEQARRSEY
jgi:hypothetical protein